MKSSNVVLSALIVLAGVVAFPATFGSLRGLTGVGGNANARASRRMVKQIPLRTRLCKQ